MAMRGEKRKDKRRRYLETISQKNKVTKAEKIAAIPIEEVGSLKGDDGLKQLKSYVKSLRFGYKRRIQQFKRRDLVSYAQIALEKSYPKGTEPIQLTKMTRNQLILEFARYSKFFQDKTSTLEGIIEENTRQDVRIFGANDEGIPNKRMTTKQREKFWDMYYEYLNQYKTTSTSYSSESIQQELADALFGDDAVSNPVITILLSNVEDRLENRQIQENLRSVANVYSGRGPVKSD